MTITALTDTELLEQARNGDEAAFTELYVRHQPAALRLARSYRRLGDPDDLVNGAFERVLGALRRGAGPTESFRAYLFVTLRRLAAELGERPADESIDEVPEPISDAAAVGELDRADRDIITKAFERLPDRWQAVLWHTAVEGRQPRELADVLGVTANAAAAMSYRARERLRQSYLQAHLQASPAPEHEPFRSQLGAYVRGGLSKRDQTAVEGHLEGCDSCRALVAELNDVNRSLARAVLPLFVLVGGGKLAGGAALGGAAAAGAGSDKGLGDKLKHVAQTVGSTAAIAAVVGGIVGMGTVLGREDGAPVDSAADAADIGGDDGDSGSDSQVSDSGGGSDSLFGDDDFAVSPFDDGPARPDLGTFGDDFGDDFSFDGSDSFDDTGAFDGGFDDLGGDLGDDFGDDFALGGDSDLVSPTTLPPITDPPAAPPSVDPPSTPSSPPSVDPPPPSNPPPTPPPTSPPPPTTPPPTTPPPTTPPPTTPPPTTPPPTTPPPTTPPPTTPPPTPPELTFTPASEWRPSGPDSGDLFLQIDSADAAAEQTTADTAQDPLTLEVSFNEGTATFAADQPDGCTSAGARVTCTFAAPAGQPVSFQLPIENVTAPQTATAQVISDGEAVASLEVDVVGEAPPPPPPVELSGAVWQPRDDDEGDLVVTLSNPGQAPVDAVTVTIDLDTGGVTAVSPPAGCVLGNRQIVCDLDLQPGETVLRQPLTTTGEGQKATVTVTQDGAVVAGPQTVNLTEPSG